MCGIVGAWGAERATQLVLEGLLALRHRGQEAAGLAWTVAGQLHGHRVLGPVDELIAWAELTPPTEPGTAMGQAAIGHVRYGTSGGRSLAEAQPLTGQGLALAHNGQLVNEGTLRRLIEHRGGLERCGADSELMVHLFTGSTAETDELRLREALSQVHGAYSMLLLTLRRLMAVRDPHGFRPLVLGELDHGFALASETCALDAMGAKLLREVAPGEVITFEHQQLRSSSLGFAAAPARCLFELVYFARRDSRLFDVPVHECRKEMGRALAREAPAARADLVVPVPDSGVPAALGFAEASRLPYEEALVRTPGTGRSFLEPLPARRTRVVRHKLNPVRSLVEGRRLVVVDDSLVRGTTAREVVAMLRHAGARQIHLRIASPPIRWPCRYGIDTPTRQELLAANIPLARLPAELGCDSLGFLGLEALLDAACGTDYCRACWSGCYPIPAEPFADPSDRQAGRWASFPPRPSSTMAGPERSAR